MLTVTLPATYSIRCLLTRALAETEKQVRGIFADPTPLRAVKFGDTPLY